MGFFCQNITVIYRKPSTGLSYLLFCLYTNVINYSAYYILTYFAVVHNMMGLSPN